MAIYITANKCSFDSYEVTISSPVEPGGGDHIASIDFGDVAMSYALPIKLEGVAIYGGCSLYFTSAGESYTLEVKSNIENSNAAPVLKWTYTVHGIYAPSWADVKGEINVTLNFDSCCAAGGTRYFNNSTWVAGAAPPFVCATTCSQMSSIVGGWKSLSSHASANNTQQCGPCPLTSRNVTPSMGNIYFGSAFSNPTNAAAFYAMALTNLPIHVDVSASGQDWTGTISATMNFNKPANSYTVNISGPVVFTAEGASRCLNPECTEGCSAGSADNCAGCAVNIGTGVAELTQLGGCGALVLVVGIYVYRRTFATSNSVYVAASGAVAVRE